MFIQFHMLLIDPVNNAPEAGIQETYDGVAQFVKFFFSMLFIVVIVRLLYMLHSWRSAKKKTDEKLNVIEGEMKKLAQLKLEDREESRALDDLAN